MDALRVERMDREEGLKLICRKGKFLVLGSHTPKQVTPSGDLSLFSFHNEFIFRKAAVCLKETSKSARGLRLTQFRLWFTCLMVGNRFPSLIRQPGSTRGTLRMHKTLRVITADRVNDWSFSIRYIRSERDGAGKNRVVPLSRSVLFGPFSELPEEWCGA